VPLGDLPSGTYTIELFEARAQTVAFLRRVFVAKERALLRERPAPNAEIRLGVVYSTGEQEGLHFVTRRGALKPYTADLATLDLTNGVGPRNVFLVYGNDFVQAANATRQVMTGRQPADIPAKGEGVSGAPLWVAVYLGEAGSSPPHWLLWSVERSERRLRISYGLNPDPGRSEDRLKFYSWIPLNEPGGGEYTLELFDVDKKLVTLARRVVVPE
jgi:hypothetical protein